MRKPTPLTELRKAAPGSLTCYKVADFFRKRRFPRSYQTILNFERGQYETPEDRFLELFAEAIGQSVEAVRKAHQRTRRLRESGRGPFAARPAD